MKLLDENLDISDMHIPQRMQPLREEEAFEPEEAFPGQEETEIPQPQMPPARKGPRPELVMGIIALASAIVLVVMVVFSLPYIYRERQEKQQRLEEQTLLEDAPITIPTAPALDAEDPLALEKHTEPEEDDSEEPPEDPTIPPEANPYDRLDFQYDQNNYLYCLRQRSYIGIDVSAFQREIDWQKVKDAGISYAFLRLGYRGYESGKLVEDEYIRRNLEETEKIGMPIGAYFFSQALTIKEVDEEIDFMLDILEERYLQMPIILDWEIPTADARTAQMDARTLTELQKYFCDTMAEKGYTPMIYFNWHQAKTLLYLNELEDYPFWLALYQDRMTFPYKVEFWQYTDKGRVPGIQGGVDMNVYLPDVS